MIGSRPSPSAAERMRISRKRRRNGLHHIPAVLHETEIDGLVLLGHQRRGDRNAVEHALGLFICAELGLPEQES
jgi:hypothetical protein